MSSRSINSLKDVVDWGLCIGCGACAYACRRDAVSLVNLAAVGIRPVFATANCADCHECLDVCPGYQLDASLMIGESPQLTLANEEFGPALEIWEGYATDPEIRFKASSGGLLTALALYCLEHEAMEFVLHAGADEAKPWLNRTVQSHDRGELLARAGSRYAPASPCEGLAAIEQATGPCAFIGKPCDAAAVAMACQSRPELESRIGIILTFFCAGTPSTRGTLELLRSLAINPAEVDTLHYRGEGWPGGFKVTRRADHAEAFIPYEEAWGRLNRYRPFRCHLCPDGLGRIADIACGDAWQHKAEAGDPGRSILLVRTARGQRLVQGALRAGYLTLRPLPAADVLVAQQNLLERRRQIFGRTLAMRLLGVPVPRFDGFSLLRSWLRIPLRMKARTVLGTLRRILKRGLWRARPLTISSAPAIVREPSATQTHG